MISVARRYEGEAERTVTKVFKEAAARAPCCILIDNIDLLCYSRTAPGASELQKRVVACLLTLMDGINDNGSGSAGAGAADSGMECHGAGVFIIGTTARVGDIDAAVRRAGRIDKEIEIAVPSAVDREAILLNLLHKAGVPVSDANNSANGDKISGTSSSTNHAEGELTEKMVREVAQFAHGMVGSDLLSVVKEAYYLTMREHETPHVSTASASGADKDGKIPGDEDAKVELSVGNLADEFAELDVGTGDEGTTTVTSAAPTTTAATATTIPPATVIMAPVPTPVSSALPSENRAAPTITGATLRLAVSRISPSALREVVIEVPKVRWTDIGGMEDVKQSLREVSVLYEP